MIRDINAKGLKHTDVKCISGGVQNVRETLNEYTDLAKSDSLMIQHTVQITVHLTRR